MEATARQWFAETEETIKKRKQDAETALQEAETALQEAETALQEAEKAEDFKAYKTASEAVTEARKQVTEARKQVTEAGKAKPQRFTMKSVMYAVVALLTDSTLTDEEIAEICGISKDGLRAYTPGIRYTLKALEAMKG